MRTILHWLNFFLWICIFFLRLDSHIHTHSHMVFWFYDHNIRLCMDLPFYVGFFTLYLCFKFQLGSLNAYITHTIAHLYVYSQTERHRHHTSTFEDWQQQKYTIKRNRNDALGFFVCMWMWKRVRSVYEYVELLWMCMRSFGMWNWTKCESESRQWKTFPIETKQKLYFSYCILKNKIVWNLPENYYTHKLDGGLSHKMGYENHQRRRGVCQCVHES